jgi:4-hydroxybenzoate polyprenyltransferase
MPAPAVHPAFWRAVWEHGRISNLPSVWFNLAGGWFLGGGSLSPGLAWLALGGAGFYLGGMTWNDTFDAAWDRLHKKDRPIPSGRITLRAASLLGAFWIGLGWLGCFLAGASPLAVSVLFGAIVAYNAYHKPWAGSVIIMGLCRTALYPVAASAAGFRGSHPWVLHPCWWGLLLGVYIIGVTLCARSEACGGKGQGLAATALLLPFLLAAASLAAIPAASPSWIIWAAFLLLVLAVMRKLRDKTDPGRIGTAVGWLLAAMIGIDLMALSVSGLAWVWTLAPLVFLLRYFQKFVAAT